MPIGNQPPNPIDKPQKTKPNMEAFRNDINDYVSKLEKGKLPYAIDVFELTEDDADMWYRVKEEDNFKKNPIPREQFKKYTQDALNSKSSSRISFNTIIANKIGELWLKYRPEDVL